VARSQPIHGDTAAAAVEGCESETRWFHAFASFALAGATSIKEIGAGVAVAIDATAVRLVLVPAIRLLGDWNWWLPLRRREGPETRAEAV